MLLAIDIGNSQTSFGLFESCKLTYHWRIETRARRTSHEYAALFFPLVEQAGLKNIKWEGVVLCSVVPMSEEHVERFCRDYFKLIPMKIDQTLDLGFSLNVEVPAEVGADRLANAAYAVKYLNLPALVIDFGTATTFDLISKDKAYEGGIIFPGVWLSVNALSSQTAKLPSIDLAFPDSVVGKNTISCIQSGLLFGYCDLLDGLLDRFYREVGTQCHTTLTGGLAYLFQNRLKNSCTLIPNLTLEGIELLYWRNQKK